MFEAAEFSARFYGLTAAVPFLPFYSLAVLACGVRDVHRPDISSTSLVNQWLNDYYLREQHCSVKTVTVHLGRFADENEVVLVARISPKLKKLSERLLESSYSSAEYR